MKKTHTPYLQGFDLVDHPGASVLAREEAIPWVRYVLEGGTTLYQASAGERDGFELPGRSPVFAIPAKGGGKGPPVGCEQGPDTAEPEARWAVRHFSRGGRIVSRLLGDRYLNLGVPRPFHEAQVSEEARTRGVPTPRVMAAALYPDPPFYRGDLVTEFVGGSTDLLGALFDFRKSGVGGAAERLDALKATGGLIRKMGQAGLRHGDLHAGNILLRWEGVLPSALILDLGRSELLEKGTPAPPGPMLKRLNRSLRKWEEKTGLRLTEVEWEALDRATQG
jgi:tRNA A-37 threonylcarbamoyl transferase component Bud32